MMKNYIYLIIAFVSIVLTACDLNGTTNNTPQILFATKPRLISDNDSLSYYLTDNAGVYKLDTISVGDTVAFPILLNGFSNHLTIYYLTQSDTTITRIILPSKNSLDSIFITSSNYSMGRFIFRSNIYNLYFPFKYVALKPSNDVTISFSLTSDANFDGNMISGTNSVSFVLKTPIKAAKPSSVIN
jgi:hypothetical protein